MLKRLLILIGLYPHGARCVFTNEERIQGEQFGLLTCCEGCKRTWLYERPRSARELK